MSKPFKTLQDKMSPERQEKISKEVERFLNGMPPVHPGEILNEDYLKPLGYSTQQFATRIHVQHDIIAGFVAGTYSLHEFGKLPLILTAELGTSAEFWLNLQRAYDEAKARE